MATVLERADKKAYMDDSVPLKATILTHRALPDHVEFVIRVQRGPNPADYWEVAHRYNEFADLNDVIKENGCATLPLPPKKMFGSTERQFLVERQQKLQVFLDTLLQEPLLSSRYEVKKFLDPSNYSENVYDTALRDVSMFFRSELTWNVVKPLKDIGSRFRKQYYLIESKTNPASIPYHLLSWVEPGPDFSLGHRELEVSLKTLTEIKHPYILTPLSATFNGTGLLVVRKYVPTGSLRDRICGGSRPNPQLPLLQKCFSSSSPKTRLTIADIKKYGRQMLEALQFLQSKGFVLGHIHSGNVIIDEGCCKLVDIENSLLGLIPLNRHFLFDVRKIHTTMDEVVFMFGHMLYEMANGEPLKVASIDSCPPSMDLSISPLLSSLLTPQGIKTGLPTIEALLAHEFFSSGAAAPPPAGTPPPEKPVLKVHSKLKEVLQVHAQKAEQRLVLQQKKVTEFKRISKAQESFMSEDAKMKRRRSQQKQMSLQSTEDIPEAYPTTSVPRQSSLSLSQPPAVNAVKSGAPASSSSSSSSSSTTSAAKPKAAAASSAPAPPPPPAAAPAQPRPQPPPDRANNERGALLSSIETFGKGKLKKAVTNDRSAPLVSR